MATKGKLWGRAWTGLRRWLNAEDVESERRELVAGLRLFWVTIAGLPLLLGSIIGAIGDLAGWW